MFVCGECLGGAAARSVDGADVVVALREVALNLCSVRYRGHQLSSKGEGLFMRGEGLGGMATVVLDTGNAVETF